MRRRTYVLLSLLLAPMPAVAPGPLQQACVAGQGYQAQRISGSARAGETFRGAFGERYAFVLTPSEYGWYIEVSERGRDENLARLTPPWHFVPNPRELDGWHFRNASNTAPNDGSVNAPGEVREFYFSPEVGRTLEYLGSDTPAETVDSVRAYGTGQLTVKSFELTPPEPGTRASFRSLAFDVCLIWRAAGSR